MVMFRRLISFHLSTVRATISLVLLLLVGCGQGHRLQHDTLPGVPAFRSLDAARSIIQSQKMGDDKAVGDQVYSSESTLNLDNGTKVEVISHDSGLGLTQVRVLSGSNKGSEVWVYDTSVK